MRSGVRRHDVVLPRYMSFPSRPRMVRGGVNEHLPHHSALERLLSTLYASREDAKSPCVTRKAHCRAFAVGTRPAWAVGARLAATRSPARDHRATLLPAGCRRCLGKVGCWAMRRGALAPQRRQSPANQGIQQLGVAMRCPAPAVVPQVELPYCRVGLRWGVGGSTHPCSAPPTKTTKRPEFTVQGATVKRWQQGRHKFETGTRLGNTTGGGGGVAVQLRSG